jgi:hypothetical protein
MQLLDLTWSYLVDVQAMSRQEAHKAVLPPERSVWIELSKALPCLFIRREYSQMEGVAAMWFYLPQDEKHGRWKLEIIGNDSIDNDSIILETFTYYARPDKWGIDWDIEGDDYCNSCRRRKDMTEAQKQREPSIKPCQKHKDLCWLHKTSVQEIGMLHTMEQASLPKPVRCESNQRGPFCSSSSSNTPVLATWEIRRANC